MNRLQRPALSPESPDGYIPMANRQGKAIPRRLSEITAAAVLVGRQIERVNR